MINSATKENVFLSNSNSSNLGGAIFSENNNKFESARGYFFFECVILVKFKKDFNEIIENILLNYGILSHNIKGCKNELMILC